MHEIFLIFFLQLLESYVLKSCMHSKALELFLALKKGMFKFCLFTHFITFWRKNLEQTTFFLIFDPYFLQKSMQIEDKNKQIAKIILIYEQKSSFYTLILDY